MNNKELLEKFNQALNWNAFLYVIQNGLFFLKSWLLYQNLSVEGFSLWANINCTIFLFILWLDFGFRKSIPRYAPEFGTSETKIKQLAAMLISFQLFALTVSAPIFFLIARFFLNRVGLQAGEAILYLGCTLFIVEGILRIIRLIYHSYFLQKQFNSFVSVILILQMGAILVLIKTANTTSMLLGLFGIKIVSGLAIVLGGLLGLRPMYKKIKQSEGTEGSWKEKRWSFIKHSGVMWAVGNTKSLTERNFLVPLFTFLLGPEQANLFKLANDGALFFQRVATRTIGTTDTSLFSYTDLENKREMQTAFKTLATKLLMFCLPLFGISLIAFAAGYYIPENRIASRLFLILTFGYLIYVLLSPFQRILEVKRKYKKLLFIITPYFVLIALLVFSPLVSLVGLLGSVFIIHGVRLASAASAALIARSQFGVRFFGQGAKY